MEYVIPVLLVLLLVAGLVTFLVLNATKKGARAAPDDPGAELVAVGSRTQASADEFGAEFGARRRHASYEDLAHDPGVVGSSTHGVVS